MLASASVRSSICCAALLAVLAACGGGGGGGPLPAPAGTLLASLQAVLLDTGGQAQSAAGLEVWSSGELRITITADQAWLGQLTSVPLRRGGTGVTGGVIVDFLAGAAFNGSTLSLARSLTVDAATAEEIASAPGEHHLALRTTGDFARGQLERSAPVEVDAVLADASPAARCVLTASGGLSGTVSWVLAIAGPPITEVDGISITENTASGALLAPIVLDVAGATRDTSKQTAVRDQQIPLSRLLRILARPGTFTVDVHSTGVAPPTLIGPLSADHQDVLGRLRGGPAALPGAGFSLHVPTFSRGRVVVAVPGGAGPSLGGLSAFEIHEGPKEQPGPLLFDVLAAADFVSQPDQRSGEATVAVNQELVTRMMLSPASFHARVVTAGGANVLTSNLDAQRPRFFAELGATTVPHDGQPGAAATDLWVPSAGALEFAIESANPQVAQATLLGAVAHPVGSTPTAAGLYDLLQTPASSQTVDRNLRSGVVTIDPHDVARLLADPAAIALSLTTSQAPDGVARGALRDGVPCETKYIPPFEGTWTPSAGGVFNMSGLGAAFPCGSFNGSGSVGNVQMSMTGTYVGDQVDVTVSGGGDANKHYTGTVTSAVNITTTDAVSALPATITASHGTVHGRYGRLWLSGPEYTLVFTSFPGTTLGPDPLAGFLTCNGVKIPFSGTEEGGSFSLTLALAGIDLSPCPVAVKNAYQGQQQAVLTGSLTSGVGQLSLGAPVNRVFDRPNR